MRYCFIDSPIGTLLIAGDATGLRYIHFAEDQELPKAGWLLDHTELKTTTGQLHDYFAGRLEIFDLSLVPSGTPFQQRVWQAVRAIPYGSTMTYGELARSLGIPTAARAVGAANRSNPLPIVIPCHRVVGRQGKLTGYRGGLDIKRKLLQLEQTGNINTDEPRRTIAR